MKPAIIKHLRAYVIDPGESGADYHNQHTGHWIVDTHIANPMSVYEQYKVNRMSWGINALGTVIVEAELADGTVGITFLDNTLVSAGPNSTLVIDSYRFDSTTHAGKFDASLQRGSLAVISGKMVKQSPEAMRIRTPSSVLGVRGTEFVVKVAD